MIDYHEDMLEHGCEDDEDVLNSALDVSTMLQVSALYINMTL